MYTQYIMSKYSAIFFDWSGVVADDSGDDFIEQLFKNVGATDVQAKEIIETYFVDFLKGTISETELWRVLRRDYGFNITEAISKDFEKWPGLVANKEIIKFAYDLKVQGYKIAVLTNIIKPVYDIIKQTGQYDLFSDVVASCEVGMVKPNKEIYELALKNLGVIPQESIFIDDKIANIRAAEKIGFKTMLARNPQQIIDDLICATSS